MKRFTDTYTDVGRRKRLVDLLKEKGITDANVLDAINTIPRHFYVDTVFDAKAYDDIAIQIAAEQTISQPYTVAFQTQLLNITKGNKVFRGWNWQCLPSNCVGTYWCKGFYH